MLTVDNRWEIFTEGKALYGELTAQIRAAKTYIHILSYIIRRDEVFAALEMLNPPMNPTQPSTTIIFR